MEPAVYVRGETTTLWMLQNFKHQCSLRLARVEEYAATGAGWDDR